ncbi:MAG: hypothetical protein V7607_3494 [Solirubrobacteraceae bacterium]
MKRERINTRSVSRDVVETDPIVLRDGQRTRLVFLPTLVDQQDDPLRGCFVYQRKLAAGEWEDVKGLSLAGLKAGEGWALELHSAEVSSLMNGLLARKALYEKHGIVWGKQSFVRKTDLPRAIQELVDSPDSDLADALGALNVEDIIGLSRQVDLSKLDVLLAEWQTNEENGREEFWQQLLARNAWVFSQLTGSPVVLLKSKAYVGGKSIDNTGGGEVDYLVRNELTDNVSFIEIKTPLTPLTSSSYRTSGSFGLAKGLTGGLMQVLGYKQQFENEFYAARSKSSAEFRSYNPRCYLIAGQMGVMDGEEIRSLELFRNALAGIQILTFDEVAIRLQGIRDALTT